MLTLMLTRILMKNATLRVAFSFAAGQAFD
jgi:hypothetical protein